MEKISRTFLGRSLERIPSADAWAGWARWAWADAANSLCNPWCARLGSNQQPLPSEGSTLSIELRTQRFSVAVHVARAVGK